GRPVGELVERLGVFGRRGGAFLQVRDGGGHTVRGQGDASQPRPARRGGWIDDGGLLQADRGLGDVSGLEVLHPHQEEDEGGGRVRLRRAVGVLDRQGGGA